MYKLRLAVALILTLNLANLSGQTTKHGESFVPGEVIVKFRPDSEAGKIVQNASMNSKEPNTALKSVIDSFGLSVNMPLAVKHLVSGGNVLIRVRQSDVLTRLLQELRSNRSVRNARISGGAVVIRFAAGTPESQIVDRSTGVSKNSQLDELMRRLSPSTETKAQLLSDKEVLVKPDLKKLTIGLVETLRARKDIENAQPNYLHEPMSAGPTPDIQ